MYSAILSFLATFIVGFVFGLFHSKLLEGYKKLTELHKKATETPPPKQSYVSLPSYNMPNLTKQTSQVINPKTPEQLNREAQAKTMQELSKR
jgi:hypothetical protein